MGSGWSAHASTRSWPERMSPESDRAGVHYRRPGHDPSGTTAPWASPASHVFTSCHAACSSASLPHHQVKGESPDVNSSRHQAVSQVTAGDRAPFRLPAGEPRGDRGARSRTALEHHTRGDGRRRRPQGTYPPRLQETGHCAGLLAGPPRPACRGQSTGHEIGLDLALGDHHDKLRQDPPNDRGLAIPVEGVFLRDPTDKVRRERDARGPQQLDLPLVEAPAAAALVRLGRHTAEGLRDPRHRGGEDIAIWRSHRASRQDSSRLPQPKRATLPGDNSTTGKGRMSLDAALPMGCPVIDLRNVR